MLARQFHSNCKYIFWLSKAQPVSFRLVSSRLVSFRFVSFGPRAASELRAVAPAGQELRWHLPLATAHEATDVLGVWRELLPALRAKAHGIDASVSNGCGSSKYQRGKFSCLAARAA
jgi:hypothetical protein